MERLRPDQQRAAALTLAEAFANDPLLEILAPDPARRVKLGPPMMGVLLAYGMRYGHVWSNDDASAVAIWLHPESGPMTMPRMLRAGMWRAPFMLGLDGMGRMSKAMSATEGFHKQVEGPHWYLMTVGTRTARQGQGLGSKLVEMGTSRADAAGVPCYLETGTDSNIAFYRKRGFEVVGQADCYGYTLTGMIRPPRTPADGRPHEASRTGGHRQRAEPAGGVAGRVGTLAADLLPALRERRRWQRSHDAL